MEIKHWNEYSIEEKKALLYFWWRSIPIEFYLMTARESEQFDQIVDMDIDLVFATVVTLHFNGYNGRALFEAVRAGSHSLCVMLNRVLEYRTAFSVNGRFDAMSDEVLSELVQKYNKMNKNVEGEVDSGKSF